ncbi:amino acid ABC transporter substrate-binding protein [Crassaminicella thermophila]|uniref:Amino acid ABC transporter substrate-binding protein n=1 Tax=Crassaminicella thermophila TaxID=2599308 RepID=A0A5C0SET1_CRATE|nr:amino acid ABC transporter substrate-binding protein [Crassaminicella thermophila]QEK12670.1 amino acid ABC transporter substrate-binding protein [Crassaminicella thermophila]
MKKKITILFMAMMVFTMLLSGCGQKQEVSEKEDKSLQEIKEKGNFILGLDDSFPPMGFRDEKGEIVGFDIDLAKEVAKRMGVELKVKPIDWDGKVLSLNNKDIDVIWNGLTITEERKKQIGFSKVYIENRQIIVVNSDSDIQTKKDLADKIVAVQLGSSGEDALNADVDTVKSVKEVRKFSNYTEALLDLKAKRVDAVVIDEIVGRYYMAKRPKEYKVAKEDFGKEGYGIGFRLGDVAFKEEVDKILDEMKKDGTAAEISKKWFGEDILAK